MIFAQGHAFDRDHLDFDYRQTEDWPRVSPDPGAPPSLWISLGDEQCGPAVQLGICQVVPENMWLDTHYHASDQFRGVIRGDFKLQVKHMQSGDFGFQVAGVPYREGLVGGGAEPLWMFALHGDRRGARSTITRRDGSFPLGAVAEDQLDREVDSPDDPYWQAVPGGARGIAALAVSEGRTVGGFHWGNFSQAAAWRAIGPGLTGCAALLGNVAAGPMLVMLHAEPDAPIMAPCVADTETLVATVSGGVMIGDKTYRDGLVRVQSARAPLPAIGAGKQGADVILLIADRRALPQSAQDDGGRAGLAALATLRDDLLLRLEPAA